MAEYVDLDAFAEEGSEDEEILPETNTDLDFIDDDSVDVAVPTNTDAVPTNTDVNTDVVPTTNNAFPLTAFYGQEIYDNLVAFTDTEEDEEIQDRIINALRAAWVMRDDETFDTFFERVSPPTLDLTSSKECHLKHLDNVADVCKNSKSIVVLIHSLKTRCENIFYCIRCKSIFQSEQDILPMSYDKLDQMECFHWFATQLRLNNWALHNDMIDEGIMCQEIFQSDGKTTNSFDDGTKYKKEETQRPKEIKCVISNIHSNSNFDKEMYRAIMNKLCYIENFHKYLINCAKANDDRKNGALNVPVFRPNRKRLAFDNGVFCADKFKFIPWERYNAVEEPHNANYLSGYQMDPRWFDEEAPDHYLPETPHTDKIWEKQGIEINTDTHRVLRAICIGRMMFNLKDKDNWQIIPFIVGVAGTGKSTIAEEILYQIYPFSKVAILDSQAEARWIVGSLKGKYLWTCTEMTGKCSWAQGTFQQLVAGERVQSEIKHQTPGMEEFRLPGIMMANESLIISNTRGSGTRRVVGIPFMTEVPKDEQRGSFSDDVRKELAANIFHGVRDYLWLVKEVENKYQKSIWKALIGIDEQFFKNGTVAAYSDNSIISCFINEMLKKKIFVADPKLGTSQPLDYYIDFDIFKEQALVFAKNQNRETELKWTNKNIASALDVFKAMYKSNVKCRWPPVDGGVVQDINIVAGLALREHVGNASNLSFFDQYIDTETVFLFSKDKKGYFETSNMQTLKRIRYEECTVLDQERSICEQLLEGEEVDISGEKVRLTFDVPLLKKKRCRVKCM